jgi:hypothetical protein
VQLKKRGVAGLVICSTPFKSLAKHQAKVFGMPDLEIVFIDHPLGGITLDKVAARAAQASDQVLAGAGSKAATQAATGKAAA